MLMAALARPAIKALAYSSPLPTLIKALDAVTMPIAFKTIRIWIEGTATVGAVETRKLLREAMTITRLMIACTLSIAYTILELSVFVRDRA
jgi:hypothetical protein